jgi:hypothetical protein
MLLFNIHSRGKGCLPSVALQWIPDTGIVLPFYNSPQSVTAKDSFHSLLDYERLLSHDGWQIDLIPAAD